MSKDNIALKKNLDTSKEEQEGVNLKLVDEENDEQITGYRKKRLSKYYYRITNHKELFNIGKSFYGDYIKGVKNFAIASNGFVTSQQKTILGLASYFDHQEDIKIAIVSDNLLGGSFKELVDSSDKVVRNELQTSEKKFEIFQFHDHFDFIDLNKIIRMCPTGSPNPNFEALLRNISNLYEVIFWDVPDLEKIREHQKIFLPITVLFDSLTIIVSQNVSKSKEIEDIRDFFAGYGIRFKGLLIEPKKENK